MQISFNWLHEILNQKVVKLEKRDADKKHIWHIAKEKIKTKEK